MPSHPVAARRIARHGARLQTRALGVLPSNHGNVNRTKAPPTLAADADRPTNIDHRQRHLRHLRTLEPARATDHQTNRRVRSSLCDHRAQSPHRPLSCRGRVAGALERDAQTRELTHHRRDVSPRGIRRRFAQSARDHPLGKVGADVARRRQQHRALAHLSPRARSHGVSYRTRHRDRRARRKAASLPQPHRDHQRRTRAHAIFSQAAARPRPADPRTRPNGSSPTRSSASTIDTSRSKPTPAQRASKASSNQKSAPIARSSQRG